MFRWLMLRLAHSVEPAKDALPSHVGAGTMSVDFKIMMLPINWEVPEIGDVVCVLTECGMGAQIIKDHRIRVTSSYETPGFTGERGRPSFINVVGDDMKAYSIAYMRRHKTVPRTWLLFQ